MKKLDNAALSLMTVLALAMIAYHMIYTQMVFLTPTQHQNLHLMFGLVLVYLWAMRKAKSWAGKITALVLMALSVYATGYIFVEYEQLETMRGPTGFINTQDIIVGTLIVGLSLEASRRSFGLAFPIVALCFIAYCKFGYLVPGALSAPVISYKEMINTYVTNLSGGVYSNTMSVSANYIFLFVVFGALLSGTGAALFFNRIGAAAGRRLAGGPAISAVISSAFMGSITGSALANVATTGPFTIPLMKKAGYTPEQAGAIEAAASTGGQIMPPVMGATAFVMADMINAPYREVMAAAIIPALLYFLSIGLYAQLHAKRLNLDPRHLFDEEETDDKALLWQAPLFIGPLVLIMIMLFMGYSPMFTVFWAIVFLLLINLVKVWREGKLADMLGVLIPEARDGAVTGAKIAVTCAVLGPIVASMTKTALGIRIPGIIALLSGGNLLVAILITAVVCIILGMGVPTVAAYMLVAMVGAPCLVALGLPLFSAHMCVFVFAVFSCITPPIATAVIPAAGLAGGSYLRTCVEATKVGCVGFVIPFLCVYAPEIMLGQSPTGMLGSGLIMIWGALAVLVICMSFTGYSVHRLTMPARLAAAGACVMMVAAMLTRSPLSIGLAVAMLLLFAATDWLKCRSERRNGSARASVSIL